MSIAVELTDLAGTIARYRFAYLLTGSAQGAPHAVAVTPRLEEGVLVIEGLGRRSRDNLQARPAVGLVWPPQEASGYSLIIDGQATMAGELLRITPERAVLHRPAPSSNPAAPGACGSDCVELPLPVSAAARASTP